MREGPSVAGVRIPNITPEAVCDKGPLRQHRHEPGPVERVRAFVHNHPVATLVIGAGLLTLAVLAIFAASRRRRSS